MRALFFSFVLLLSSCTTLHVVGPPVDGKNEIYIQATRSLGPLVARDWVMHCAKADPTQAYGFYCYNVMDLEEAGRIRRTKKVETLYRKTYQAK